MDNAILQIVMRYIHIVSAIVAVGGMAFMLFCLIPAASLLEEPQCGASLLATLHRRFTRVLWFCIAGLLVSGVYNWIMLAPIYREIGPAANALIGIKVLIAMAIFAIIWAHWAGFIKAENPRRLLMINIHLAAVVILLAAILRYLRLDHLQHPLRAALDAVGLH